MQKTTFLKALLVSLFCCLTLLTGQAFANEGKGGGEGGGLTAPLEPFTVNLSSFDRYLQVSITLQLAHAEVGEKIKTYMPVIRHSMIMLLSGKESAQIQTADGKHELMDEIKERVNKVLELKENEGITDVYFVNFVIQ